MNCFVRELSEGGCVIQAATRINATTPMEARRSFQASNPYKNAFPPRTTNANSVSERSRKDRKSIKIDVGQNNHRTTGRTSPSIHIRSYSLIPNATASPTAAPPKNHALLFTHTALSLNTCTTLSRLDGAGTVPVPHAVAATSDRFRPPHADLHFNARPQPVED